MSQIAESLTKVLPWCRPGHANRVNWEISRWATLVFGTGGTVFSHGTGLKYDRCWPWASKRRLVTCGSWFFFLNATPTQSLNAPYLLKHVLISKPYSAWAAKNMLHQALGWEMRQWSRVRAVGRLLKPLAQQLSSLHLIVPTLRRGRMHSKKKKYIKLMNRKQNKLFTTSALAVFIFAVIRSAVSSKPAPSFGAAV